MAASIGDSGPYSGEVTPGGPPDTRELAGLIITKLAVDPEMSNNCYLLRCRATDEQVLIDAAAEPEQLRQLIGPSGLTRVITTHQHWDHHRALADVVAATGAVVVAGADDAAAITEQTGVDVDDQVQQGDTVEFGNCRLEVIHLVGHTPGSIALLYDDPEGTPHLWTGDSLFPGGVGNTFGDKEAFDDPDRRRRAEGVRPARPTRPGSTRVTATTPFSASSGAASRIGWHAGGSGATPAPLRHRLTAPHVLRREGVDAVLTGGGTRSRFLARTRLAPGSTCAAHRSAMSGQASADAAPRIRHADWSDRWAIRSRARPRAWSKSNSSSDLRPVNRAVRIRPSPAWTSRAATSALQARDQGLLVGPRLCPGPFGEPVHRLAQRGGLQRPGQIGDLGADVLDRCALGTGITRRPGSVRTRCQSG